MPIYNLYWNNRKEGVIIYADISVDKMRKLVKEFMSIDYDDDIISFLNEKGVRATYICGYESESPVTILGEVHSIKLFY